MFVAKSGYEIYKNIKNYKKSELARYAEAEKRARRKVGFYETSKLMAKYSDTLVLRKAFLYELVMSGKIDISDLESIKDFDAAYKKFGPLMSAGVNIGELRKRFNEYIRLDEITMLTGRSDVHHDLTDPRRPVPSSALIDFSRRGLFDIYDELKYSGLRYIQKYQAFNVRITGDYTRLIGKEIAELTIKLNSARSRRNRFQSEVLGNKLRRLKTLKSKLKGLGNSASDNFKRMKLLESSVELARHIGPGATIQIKPVPLPGLDHSTSTKVRKVLKDIDNFRKNFSDMNASTFNKRFDSIKRQIRDNDLNPRRSGASTFFSDTFDVIKRDLINTQNDLLDTFEARQQLERLVDKRPNADKLSLKKLETELTDIRSQVTKKAKKFDLEVDHQLGIVKNPFELEDAMSDKTEVNYKAEHAVAADNLDKFQRKIENTSVGEKGFDGYKQKFWWLIGVAAVSTIAISATTFSSLSETPDEALMNKLSKFYHKSKLIRKTYLEQKKRLINLCEL